MTLCILDVDVRSYREINFFAKDIDAIIFPPNLSLPVKKFIKIAEKYGMYYPTVKIKNDLVTLKYDQEHKYVIFYISENKIDYGFGILGGKPKINELYDLNSQLRNLSNFVYTP